MSATVTPIAPKKFTDEMLEKAFDITAMGFEGTATALTDLHNRLLKVEKAVKKTGTGRGKFALGFAVGVMVAPTVRRQLSLSFGRLERWVDDKANEQRRQQSATFTVQTDGETSQPS